MRTATLIVTLLVAVVASTLLFYLFQHELSSVWLDVALRPEVRETLERSLGDQKKLYAADPPHGAEYRARFERTRTLLARMEVLELSRRELARRYELLLVSIFAITFLSAGIVSVVRSRRDERRLAVLQRALAALSRGEAGVRVGDERRDVIGRIARMVESTSDVVTGQRQRLEYLEHLSAWQEAARRHAHEIRTPLTAAQLEIDRLVTLSRDGVHGDELERTRDGIYNELERLSRFTKQFSSFAAIGPPSLVEEPLDAIVDEFSRTFANAWPLALRIASTAANARARVDRDLLRQVLANLCSNAAQAGAHNVTFATSADARSVIVDVSDDGGGIADRVRARLFEPYATTRPVGEGLGLGLAISRKILLDHGGDLALVATSSAGTVFRLTLPQA
jgi:two-component system nitrogen regulation sensor histidine kinase NtrY